ncbi:MAG: hypothetical protein R2785_12315 [Flavobacteriaceae bacterium]
MKKVLTIVAILITFGVTSQDEGNKTTQRQGKERMKRMEKLNDFSPEEIATLQTKKMALHLDLSEAQQKQIQALHLEQAKARKVQMEAMKKMREEGKELQLSKEERFDRANKQLDNKIAMKAKMKDILSKEQYEKWEKSNAFKGNQRMKMRKIDGEKRKQRH